MKAPSTSSDLSIAEQAARWVLEIEDPGPTTLADFAVWLKASPVHVEEFLLATSVWKSFDGFDANKRIQLDRMLEELKGTVQGLDLAAPAAPVEKAPPQSAAPARRWIFAALGIAAAVLSGWLVVSLLGGPPESYATATGEQRAFKLEDGSIVYVNTQSRVAVQFSEHARTVKLLAGEALFTVERDPKRPFRVEAGDAVIQAIGTQFNVYRKEEGTTVSVVEGVVQILPGLQESQRTPATEPSILTVPAARLTAGEQARVTRGQIDKKTVSDLDQVVAWRQRRLVFRGTSLDDVAREFNRYNTLQIALESPEIGSKRLTGVFDADDPESLVLFLSGDTDLAIDKDASTVHIRLK